MRVLRLLAFLMLLFFSSYSYAYVPCDTSHLQDDWGAAYDASENCPFSGFDVDGSGNQVYWCYTLNYLGNYVRHCHRSNSEYKDWDSDGIPDERDPPPPSYTGPYPDAPTCNEGQLAILGQCIDNYVPLAGLLGTMQHVWQKLPSGVWAALPEGQLGQELKTGADLLNELLAKDYKLADEAISDFEKLLKKPYLPGSRVTSAASKLSRFVPVVGTIAGAGVLAWEMYDYGRVYMDAQEIRATLGGSCPSGFDGYDCGFNADPQALWPSDGKPTYVYKPTTQSIEYHPRDSDRVTIDMVQNPQGTWEASTDDYGNPVDTYWTPNFSGTGPAVITQTYLPSGPVTRVQTSNKGDFTFWFPSLVPFTLPGSIRDPIVFVPGLRPPSSTEPTDNPYIYRDTLYLPPLSNELPYALPAPAPTGQPLPITDPIYQPIPTTDTAPAPDPVSEPEPDTITQPEPLTYVDPDTQEQRDFDPATDPYTAPIPGVTPTTNPGSNPSPSNSSCGCELNLPSPDAPSLAETSKNLLESYKTGLGIDSFTVPVMSGACPLLSIDTTEEWFGVLSTDVHCQIIESNRALIQAFGSLVWMISAFLIFVSA